MRLLGCHFGDGRPSAAPELRRGKTDRQTFAEAMEPGDVGSCMVAFGVHDADAQQTMDMVSEALPADEGNLPHLHPEEVINIRFPSMVLEDVGETLCEDRVEDGQVLEKVGEAIAAEIISKIEALGRRRREQHQ